MVKLNKIYAKYPRYSLDEQENKYSFLNYGNWHLVLTLFDHEYGYLGMVIILRIIQDVLCEELNKTPSDD